MLPSKSVQCITNIVNSLISYVAFVDGTTDSMAALCKQSTAHPPQCHRAPLQGNIIHSKLHVGVSRMRVIICLEGMWTDGLPGTETLISILYPGLSFSSGKSHYLRPMLITAEPIVYKICTSLYIGTNTKSELSMYPDIENQHRKIYFQLFSAQLWLASFTLLCEGLVMVIDCMLWTLT